MAQLVGGIMLGIALGALGVFVLRRFALPAAGLYPIAALAWAVLAYGVATQISVSGFAAVYICAMFLGNGRLPHRHATQAFAEGTGWLAQIGLFVMLGMLASPSRITWDIILLGLVAGLFLTFVVRPVAVVLCAVWFRIPGGSRRSSPGRGCAARSPSSSPPCPWPRIWTMRTGFSTSCWCS